jgi:integrase
MRAGDRADIQALQPGQSVTVEGVEVLRTADGDLKFLLNAKIEGRRRHELIGFASERMTFQKARAHVERVRTEARQRRLRLPQGKERPLRIRSLGDQYLAKLAAVGGKDMRKKRERLRLHIYPALGTEPLMELTTDRLAEYRQQRLAEGASQATINREFAVIRHMMTVAVDSKWIAQMPCRAPKVKEERVRRLVLTPAEQDALMRAASNDVDSYVYLFVAFGLNTVMRHAEILSSRFEHVIWIEGRLLIPAAKAGKREVPITPELLDMLRREQEAAADPAGWIFPTVQPGRSGTGHRMTMAGPFKRVVRRAGLERAVTPHLMRHTGITRLLKSGVDLRTAAEISGHRTITMLLHYLQSSASEANAAVRVLGQALPQSYHDAHGAVREPHRKKAIVVAFPKK